MDPAKARSLKEAPRGHPYAAELADAGVGVELLPPPPKPSLRLRIAARLFRIGGWLGLCTVPLSLVPYILVEPAQRVALSPLIIVLFVLGSIASLIVGKDLANRRRRGAIGALFLLLAPFATAVDGALWHPGFYVNVLLALLVLSTWRELE